MESKWIEILKSTKGKIGIGIIALVIIIICGVYLSGAFNGSVPNAKNLGTYNAVIFNKSVDPEGSVYEIKIKVNGTNIPEGQKTYFKVVGNINGTPSDEIFFSFPEGSKLANGMILSVGQARDLSIYNTITVYFFDKNPYNATTVDAEPIANVTINNT
jgi:hypothetical protein